MAVPLNLDPIRAHFSRPFLDNWGKSGWKPNLVDLVDFILLDFSGFYLVNFTGFLMDFDGFSGILRTLVDLVGFWWILVDYMDFSGFSGWDFRGF